MGVSIPESLNCPPLLFERWTLVTPHLVSGQSLGYLLIQCFSTLVNFFPTSHPLTPSSQPPVPGHLVMPRDTFWLQQHRGREWGDGSGVSATDIIAEIEESCKI